MRARTAPVRVRDAVADDVEAMGRTYDLAVAGSVASFERTPPGPDRWRARLADAAPDLPLLVATDASDRVLGLAAAAHYRPRWGYRHTRETTIYLEPGSTGRGVGRVLYRALLARLDAAGVHAAIGVVALPNDASEALHRSLGFTRVGLLAEVGHKQDRWVDLALYHRLAPRNGGD